MAEQTTHSYFRLSESYRDEHGTARQRMVLGLGRLLELPDFDHKILFLERLNELIKGRPTLFSCKEEKIEQLAQHYYAQLKLKKKVDVASDVVDDIDTVKLNTLKNKNIREIGAESLCHQALHQLGIDHYLQPGDGTMNRSAWRPPISSAGLFIRHRNSRLCRGSRKTRRYANLRAMILKK